MSGIQCAIVERTKPYSVVPTNVRRGTNCLSFRKKIKQAVGSRPSGYTCLNVNCTELYPALKAAAQARVGEWNSAGLLLP